MNKVESQTHPKLTHVSPTENYQYVLYRLIPTFRAGDEMLYEAKTSDGGVGGTIIVIESARSRVSS